MSFSEKNKHTLTNTDTMSPFLIFFIVVTIGYVLYYAAIITMDMNAKPKDAVTQGETMEAPDGMQTTEDNGGDDTEEETTSREADEENDDDNPEGHSEDETDDDHQDEDNSRGTYMNDDVPPTEPEPESQPSDAEPEDDDVYGIDKQMQEESEHQEAEPTPSPEEQLPSNQEEAHEDSSEQSSEQTPEDSPETETEPSDPDEMDEEELEAYKEQMRRHLAEVAAAEGAQMVEAEVPDKNEFVEEKDDGFRGMVDSNNYDTGLANEINQNSESIETESITPVRQDRFAQNVLGALYKMKDKQKNEPEHEHEQKEEEKPVIDPDNIEKKENITKA